MVRNASVSVDAETVKWKHVFPVEILMQSRVLLFYILTPAGAVEAVKQWGHFDMQTFGNKAVKIQACG